MTDPFKDHATSLSSPAASAGTITPSDSVNLSTSTRAIYAGTGGNIALVTVNGQTVTFANVGSGTILPVRASRILASGTTATNLIGLY